MTTISRRLEQQHPADDPGWGALVVPLQDDIVGNVRKALFVLLGAVGFVMLIACANLANLLLAKTLGRSKEIAVRRALGAGRGRIVQQMLAETMLLGLMGGAVGLALARSSLTAMVSLVARELPRANEVDLDWRVLAFTLVVAILTGIAAGLAPAWRLTRAELHDTLKQGRSRSSGESGERRLRNSLIISEVALTLVLLVGAGLLIRTLAVLRAIDPGIDPRHLLNTQEAAGRGRVALAGAHVGRQSRSHDRVRCRRGRALRTSFAAIARSATSTRRSSPISLKPSYRQHVSGWMFGSFGLRPALGRLFTEEDDLTPRAHPYAVCADAPEITARFCDPAGNVVGL